MSRMREMSARCVRSGHISGVSSANHKLGLTDCNPWMEGDFSRRPLHQLGKRQSLAGSQLELAQELHETWVVSPLFLDPAMVSSRIACGQGLRL